MSKAEKFIREHTRNCSNQSKWGVETPNKSIIYVQPWLTPDDARKAVEIGREEIYEWLRVNLCDYFDAPRGDYDMCLDDLKQAMNYDRRNV
jgi:hypothetical protein